MTDTDAAEEIERIAAQLATRIAAFREERVAGAAAGTTPSCAAGQAPTSGPVTPSACMPGSTAGTPRAELAARIKTSRIQ